MQHDCTPVWSTQANVRRSKLGHLLQATMRLDALPGKVRVHSPPHDREARVCWAQDGVVAGNRNRRSGVGTAGPGRLFRRLQKPGGGGEGG